MTMILGHRKSAAIVALQLVIFVARRGALAWDPFSTSVNCVSIKKPLCRSRSTSLSPDTSRPRLCATSEDEREEAGNEEESAAEEIKRAWSQGQEVGKEIRKDFARRFKAPQVDDVGLVVTDALVAGIVTPGLEVIVAVGAGAPLPHWVVPALGLVTSVLARGLTLASCFVVGAFAAECYDRRAFDFPPPQGRSGRCVLLHVPRPPHPSCSGRARTSEARGAARNPPSPPLISPTSLRLNTHQTPVTMQVRRDHEARVVGRRVRGGPPHFMHAGADGPGGGIRRGAWGRGRERRSSPGGRRRPGSGRPGRSAGAHDMAALPHIHEPIRRLRGPVVGLVAKCGGGGYNSMAAQLDD